MQKPLSVEYIYLDRLKKIRYYILKNGQWKKSLCWKHKDESENGKAAREMA